MATRKSTQTAETEAKAAEETANATEAAAEAAKATADAGADVAERATAAAEAGGRTAAEAADTASEEIASTADRTIDTVVLSQQQAVDRLEVSSQAMVEGVTRVQREIMDFVSERIRRDMAAQQELLSCRSLEEVRTVQARFFQTAMDQYSAEATKLMRMGQEMLQKSLAQVG